MMTSFCIIQYAAEVIHVNIEKQWWQNATLAHSIRGSERLT